MAKVLAPDGAIEVIRNADERRIVQALSKLPGPWLIHFNRMGRHLGRDWEIDVVLIHPAHGVMIIEIKGYRPEIIDGVWCRNGVPDPRSPETQARGNAKRLRTRLREADLGFRGREVEYAVCFPNVRAVDGVATTGLAPEQVITATDTDSLAVALDRLVSWSKRTGPLDDLLIYRLVHELAPNSEFEWNREALAASARSEMREVADHQVDALRSLRANRRVAVSGAAGTGKTRLATMWARDAARDDGDCRVLLTCFNKPLAHVVAEELEVFDNIRVAPVLELFRELLQESGVEVGSDLDSDSLIYGELLPAALHNRFERIADLFDVVIIDEAQDFSPAWIGLLEAMLDPVGSRSMLMLFDESQQISPRGFRAPQPEDGWAVASLTRNCRNADAIAHLLYQRFNAARMVSATPAALGCQFVASTPETVVEVVKGKLAELAADGRSTRNILVQTTSNDTRDRLREDLKLRKWEHWVEDPDGEQVLCENVHRVKGLEFDTAILVSPHSKWRDELLYVGASRAISELIVIGPPELAERMGMTIES